MAQRDTAGRGDLVVKRERLAERQSVIGLASRVVHSATNLARAAPRKIRRPPAKVLHDAGHLRAEDAVLVVIPSRIVRKVLLDLNELTGERGGDDEHH